MNLKTLSFWSVIVFLLTIVPFAHSVRFGKVNCDDYQYLGVGPRTVRKAFCDVKEAIWMPLTFLAYSVDHVASGPGRTSANVAHAGNVLGHALNAALLFVFLATVMRASGCLHGVFWPFVGALAWSLHPLRCESVAWIASKKDVLSMAFLLCALLSWCVWRQNGRRIAYGLSMFSLVLGAMAKPSVMVFIGLVVLVDYFVFRENVGAIERLLPPAWRGEADGTRDVRKALREYAVPAVLCLAVAVEATLLQRIGGATVADQGTPLWWKCLNALNSVGVYVINTFAPFRLAPQCQIRFPELPARIWLALPLGLCLLAGTGRLLRARSSAAFGLVWFVGALVPFLGVSGFGYHAFADRFTYIPAMGLSVALVQTLGRCQGWTRLAALACCACLAFLSARQTSLWKDDGTIWAQTLEVDGVRNYVANLNLALWHWETDHDVETCCRHFGPVWDHDHAAMGLNAFYYIAALVENGDFAKADEIVIGLRNAAQKVIDAGGDGQLLLAAKEMGNILVEAHQADGLVRARNALADLIAIDSKFSEQKDGLFLRAKIAEAERRPDEAQCLYRACAEASRPDAYVRYAYLRKGAGEK